MWMGYVTLLFLVFTSGVFMETCPPDEYLGSCECEQDDEEIEVTCSFSDIERLKQALSSLSGKTNVDLVLTDFTIGKMPSNLFNGIGVKKLEIDHCDLDSLSDDNQPGLLGLENSLEELSILGGFNEENVPAKLNLGHLKKLREIDLSFNAITEVGDDWFSNGPTSLEILTLSNNGIEKIGSNAFAQLNNLKQLFLHGNRFGPIKRSMLPTSANRLEILELDNNALTEIPKDIFSGMRSISEISLRTNGISTLDEATWSPIWQQLDILRLEGNNIYCDERLKWMSKLKERPSVFGKCDYPKEVHGLTLMEFFNRQSQLAN